MTTASSPAQQPGSDLPTLPEPITSFGAAVAGDYLYAYGGHIGNAHDHSAKNLAQSFARLSLTNGESWEKLPMGPPAQGLAMVAVGDQVIRIGGMQAKNEPGADGDLHSLAEVARFNPTSGQWEQLPPLPAERSSHDAVAVGSRIYVVGGWNLQGANRAWHGDLLSLDLSAKQPSWEVVSKTPFKRRALAAAAYDGKLYVMGGITSDGELSLATDIYDLATGKWSSGPELPLGDHKGNGFGIAACGLDDGVYACGLDGAV